MIFRWTDAVFQTLKIVYVHVYQRIITLLRYLTLFWVQKKNLRKFICWIVSMHNYIIRDIIYVYIYIYISLTFQDSRTSGIDILFMRTLTILSSCSGTYLFKHQWNALLLILLNEWIVLGQVVLLPERAPAVIATTATWSMTWKDMKVGHWQDINA